MIGQGVGLLLTNFLDCFLYPQVNTFQLTKWGTGHIVLGVGHCHGKDASTEGKGADGFPDDHFKWGKAPTWNLGHLELETQQ